MIYTLLAYLLPILGLVLIGSITALKNPHQKINVMFFWLSVTIASWLCALMVGDLMSDSTISLWAVRAATFIGTLIAPFVLYLGNVFPVQLKKPTWKLHSFAILPSVAFMAVAFTPWLVPSVEITSHSAQPTGLGPLYTLQSVYLVISFIISLIIMRRKLKLVNSRQRSQIKLVIAGLVGALLVNVVTGLFLTTLKQANNFSNLAGALSFVVFIGTSSYAIIRYRLFDIRLAITRVLGYVLTIGVIAVLYSLVVVFFSTNLASLGKVGINELLVLLIPTILAALTFHRVERFIAKHTQRIFYQDAYDMREVLDVLSDALITEADIDSIMQSSMNAFQKALKPSNAYLAVLNPSGVIYHQISLGRSEPPKVTQLLNKIPPVKRVVIDRQEDPTSSIAKAMANEDVEILVQLGSLTTPVGLLLLGSKQNGAMYTKQDISLLRIGAKNLGIALDNAKKYEQILHFADTMHREVKRATYRLRKANDELKTLDALKDDFIATASHQLRTPAASVHDALRMLNHPSLNKADRQDLVDLAEASSEHLVTVVRTMLNMARLQAGHFTIDKSEADLVEVTERVVDQLKVIATQKDSAIELIKPVHPLRMHVDEAKINEALSNYTENAIKYSPEHSTITVSLSQTDGRVVFEVADQGMGVPDEERKDLFGKFYRATNARQEQPDGNGIGLYVVKSIAEGHGGEAYYKPSKEHGSIFGFWIPSEKSK